MIKTVKVKKQLRVDELIKYVRDNGVNSQAFVSDCGRASVYFDSEQNFSLGEYTFGELDIERTFTVEVEEEITELTRFDRAIALLLSAQGTRLFSHDYENLTLGKILNSNNHRGLHQVYAMINGKLELIWEDK